MIYAGDLFDVLPTLPEASIDACVTDPPYELGFMGMKWDGRGVAFRPETWREVFRVLKPGAFIVAFGGQRTYHRMAVAIEDAGFEMRDSIAWLFGSGFPKNLDLGDGKGTALKPAHEPIALAWKPFKGTITACHQQHGTAALNIDKCRIETNGNGDYDHWREADNIAPHEGFEGKSFAHGVRSMTEPHQLGRWPANVVIDEVAAAAIDEQSGELTSGHIDFARHTDMSQRNVYGGFPNGATRTGEFTGDSGGASRFYYCAKPSRAERDLGCHHLEPKQRDDSRKEGNPGGDNPRNRGLQRRGNYHPTVKPIDLMRWLVRLVTPEGGTVLDPFTGSGTTGCACAFEGRKFIGIEREAEYVQIAESRIAACLPLLSGT